MDGTPLALFGGREVTHREPIAYETAGGTSDEEVQQRLEDLGYLE
jgi:hypothetical protein